MADLINRKLIRNKQSRLEHSIKAAVNRLAFWHPQFEKTATEKSLARAQSRAQHLKPKS
ncbi:hypothetical protein PsB1_1115 [Candidatus Phycosocius spiralis]|uniref:30S ribosomal protein S20 n=1 Tax=Candidatus Phycosocius spiralis TaxID=2815099 RepID=A0ABQ4PVG7_9PROT|nr:hypothetical protein PsB1_1115 [Candidatus Phycosocius spiralis]